MAQDYKAILKLLYDEFADDLIDVGKVAIAAKLQGTQQTNRSQDADGTADERVADRTADPENTAGEDSVKTTDSVEDGSERVDYYNADVFEQRAMETLQVKAVAVMNSGDVAATVKDLILMAGEVRKFEEAQITVRADIASRRDIVLANIEAQKAALLTYLDKSFDERKENFQKLFSVVDDALEKDNLQELAMGLESIIKLAESSPFKDLETVEATASALADPDHEWDF